MSITKTHIQVKLQSKLAISIVEKLGRNKRVFLEQAIIEYAKKLEKEDKLDIFIDTTDEETEYLKDNTEQKDSIETLSIKENNKDSYSFEY
ncbi:hypothetical protein [Campylobacter sp. MG1]|uniref:hypothetical protein n=1 Tax=Campylobacter sp. MG1 TaxID=2976332 RepID=UPI00226C80AB|nr:hypothetical protein [Campylobacter sp. MG1]